MKKVIDGRIYNTDTATYICDVPCSAISARDFHWHDTGLYLSPRGRYFVAGEGGPSSMWARQVGNAYSNGHGLRLITKSEARSIAEDANLSDEEFAAFGFEVEEG